MAGIQKVNYHNFEALAQTAGYGHIRGAVELRYTMLNSHFYQSIDAVLRDNLHVDTLHYAIHVAHAGWSVPIAAGYSGAHHNHTSKYHFPENNPNEKFVSFGWFYC